jgi:hypothetical protein
MLLFHWSPTVRRGQINHYGFRPGQWSTDRLWRPPFVCFADSPSFAWSLSGATARGREIASWDLWQTWADRLEGYEVIPADNGAVREYRVYHRIYKRDIWYVATRTRD